MKKIFNVKIILIVLISGVVLTSCGNSNNKELASENTATTPLESGKKIYRKFCIQCHGYDGTLMASGSKNLKESTLNSEERISFIKVGKGAMISYKGILTDNEIEMVSTYIETFRK